MAFNKADAVKAARNIWAGPRIAEAARLNYIANAVAPARAYAAYMAQPFTAGPGRPTVEMPVDAPQVMKNLAWKSRTNFLPLVLDSFTQLLKVDGYLEANGKPSGAWSRWQTNGLDARQEGIHRSALQFGASYASILPGTMSGADAAVIHGYSPRRMTAVYVDPDVDDWPMLALDVNGPMLRLFDETHVYRIGLENHPVSGLGALSNFTPAAADWKFLDMQEHGQQFCPVSRFRDRMLLDGEAQFGIVEPLIDIQKRVDEATYSEMVGQYYQVFKQRYVIGWMPESEQELLKTAASEFWAFESENVKVGELPGQDPSSSIKSKEAALSDMASIAQIDASTFGAGGAAHNVSAEYVASKDSGKDRKAGGIRTSLGETWELTLRAAAALDGDEAAANDTSSQVRWKDMTTTSPGAIVDALGKMQAMLGIPAELLWKRIPGWTDQDQIEAEELVRSGDSLDKLMVTLSKQSQGVPADNPGGQQQSEVGNPTPQRPIAAGLGGA